MDSTNRIVAWIFAVLFVCFAAPGLLIVNLHYGLFTPNSYKQAFEENHAYAKAPQLLAELIVTGIKRDARPQAASVLKGIKPDELGRALAPALPEVWVREAGNDLIDGVFADARGEEATPVVPMGKLRRSLIARGGQAFHIVAEGKPDCTAAQMAADTAALVLVCKLPPEQQRIAIAINSEAIQYMAQRIPENLEVGTISSQTERLGRRAAWRTISSLATTIPFLAALSLGIVLASAIRGGLSELRWLGSPMLASGILALALGGLGYSAIRLKVRESFRIDGLASEPGPLRRLLVDIGDSMINSVASTVMIETAILIVLGASLLFAARRVEAKKAARLAED
jgi:hypothetical protein